MELSKNAKQSTNSTIHPHLWSIWSEILIFNICESIECYLRTKGSVGADMMINLFAKDVQVSITKRSPKVILLSKANPANRIIKNMRIVIDLVIREREGVLRNTDGC